MSQLNREKELLSVQDYIMSNMMHESTTPTPTKAQYKQKQQNNNDDIIQITNNSTFSNVIKKIVKICLILAIISVYNQLLIYQIDVVSFN